MSKKIIERRKASVNVAEDKRASIANFEAKQKRSAVKGILLTVVIVIAIAALLFLVVNALINNISKNISPAGSYKDIDPVIAKDTLDSYKQNSPYYNGIGATFTEYDKLALLASNNHSASSNAIVDDENVFNYAIYGVENSAVDVVIIASINKETKELTYVMLDSFSLVYIPYADVIGPLKDAYNFGGANLLSRTVSQNFGIDIDGYVDLKLDGAIEMIDAIAPEGLEFAINDAEYEELKKSIDAYAERFGTEIIVPAKKGETVTLNGVQSLAYMRGLSKDREFAIFGVLVKLTKEALKDGVKGVNLLSEKLADNATTSTNTKDFSTLLRIVATTAEDVISDSLTTVHFGKDTKTLERYQGCTFVSYDYSKAVADLKTALYAE